MPPVLAFDPRDAFALERPRQDHRRTPGGPRAPRRTRPAARSCRGRRRRWRASRRPASARHGVHVVLPHRRPALAEPVHVDDAAQVVELVTRRPLPLPTPSLRPSRRRRAARRSGSRSRCAVRSARCRSPRRCPGRATRSRRRRTTAAASDALRGRSRACADPAVAPREQADFRPRRVEDRRRVPFESTKRSLSACCGFCGSNRISAKKSVATISAADMHVVGWPLPAAVVERIESMRSWVATFWRAGDDGWQYGQESSNIGSSGVS